MPTQCRLNADSMDSGYRKSLGSSVEKSRSFSESIKTGSISEDLTDKADDDDDIDALLKDNDISWVSLRISYRSLRVAYPTHRQRVPLAEHTRWSFLLDRTH